MEQFSDARGEWANRTNEAGGRPPFSGWRSRPGNTGAKLAWLLAALLAFGWLSDAIGDQIEAEALHPAAEYVR